MTSIKGAAESVAAAVAQLDGAIAGVAAIAQQSAATSQEVSALAQEQSATFTEITREIHDVSSMAQELRAVVSRGMMTTVEFPVPSSSGPARPVAGGSWCVLASTRAGVRLCLGRDPGGHSALIAWIAA